MASLEHVNEVIKKVAKFLSPLLPLASCHMVDYITANHWENLVPEKIREDLSDLPREQLQHIPSASLLNELGDQPVDTNWSIAACSLPSYLSAIRQHSLSSLGVLTPVDEILEIYGPQEVATLPMKGVMSEKKTHEVETMSRVISRLAKGCEVNWIVDLGSGKGYLSTSLTLQYNLNVIAIDSSEENTSNAMVRKTKLQKFWKSLKKTEEAKLLGRPHKKGKHRIRKIKPMEAELRDSPSSQYNRDSSRHIAITAFVTENTDLLQVVRASIESEDDVSSGSLVEDGPSSITGNQSSCFENECCDIIQNSDTRGLEDGSAKYCIEDRASMSERLQESGDTDSAEHYVSQNKESPVTSQKHKPVNPMHPSEIPNLSLGFPLSKVLRDERFSLGRNSRMLSCQPANRLNCTDLIEEEELLEYDKKYGSHIRKLEMFFLFRASLAPIIEGLILLDRLAYLYEQGIESAYLVQLFDPVTSPRCHALVAFRNNLVGS